jgi:prevent-host-death family protein
MSSSTEREKNLKPARPWEEMTATATVENGHYYGHMAKTMSATTAKAAFLRLLDEAAAGEEIEITRHGRPVARLVPPTGGHSLEGLLQGSARTAGDEQDLFATEEMWDIS